MSKLQMFSGPADCSPEDVQYNPESLERLDGFFSNLVEQKKMQGASYLLARHGKVFAHKSMGFLKEWGGKDPFKPDSVRQIASITKLFTATGIMKLVEDGIIHLYKPVSAFIEEFDTDQHRNITIEHLLTHTSGAVKPDPGAMAESYPAYFFPVWPLDSEEKKHECFKGFLSISSFNEPGKEWAYSSAGFMFLAEIIARVSGMPYYDFIMENIVKPLGMGKTFFKIPKELYGETCVVEGQEGWDYREAGTMPDSLQCLSGGGGLFSTLHDLWKFGQAFLNKGRFNGNRILGEHTVKAMTFNRLKNVPAVCWGANITNITAGLGFGFDNQGLQSSETFGHEGSGRSRLLIDPKEDLIAVFFVPSAIEWLPDSIRMPPQIIWSGLE